jgi:hypothetical protein
VSSGADGGNQTAFLNPLLTKLASRLESLVGRFLHLEVASEAEGY